MAGVGRPRAVLAASAASALGCAQSDRLVTAGQVQLTGLIRSWAGFVGRSGPKRPEVLQGVVLPAWLLRGRWLLRWLWLLWPGLPWLPSLMGWWLWHLQILLPRGLSHLTGHEEHLEEAGEYPVRGDDAVGPRELLEGARDVSCAGPPLSAVAG